MTITIASVSGKNPYASVEAIARTQACIPYSCRYLLISTYCPTGWKTKDWKQLPDYGNNLTREIIGSLSAFMLFEFPKLIDTDYVILVQEDGFAVNPHHWTDEFFNYDFVGAPWPIWLRLLMKPRFNLKRAVGSGGFSLRSQKWLQAGMSVSGYNGAAEDVFALRRSLNHWTNVGCRVAPIQIAKRWSIEHRLENDPRWNIENTFGWHGHINGKPFYTLPILTAIRFVIKNHIALKKI